MLDAILYVDRTGCQWEFLPHDFPPYKTVYDDFVRWRDDGTFERVGNLLRRKLRALDGRAEEPTLGILDSQSRQATEVGGPTGFDAGKKAKGRKRHILVDILGCVLAVVVTAANVQDRDTLRTVLSELRCLVPPITNVLVDGGHRGPPLEAARREFGIGIEVVLRSDAAKGFEVIPNRWVVERTFGWLDRERRRSKEYDRNPESTRAWTHVASLRRMASWLAA